MIRRIALWLPAFLLLGVAGLFLAVYMSRVRIPPNWAPWEAVQLDEAPTWFSRMQINSLAADPEACFAALDRSGLVYRRLPERPLQNGCGLPDGGALVERAHIPYSQAFQSTCPVAAALRWYERRLTALAEVHLGQPVIRIEHWGTYACRNVYAREEGRRSQHATANAIDIAGFRLAEGRRSRCWGTGVRTRRPAASSQPPATKRAGSSTRSSGRTTTRRMPTISTSTSAGPAPADRRARRGDKTTRA